MDLTTRLIRVRTPVAAWLIMHAAHRGLLGRRGARVLPLDRAQRTECGRLFEAATPTCAMPTMVGESAGRSLALAPLAIDWHRVADVSIDSHSSCLVRGSEVYISAALAALVAGGADFSAGHCRHHGFSACVTRPVTEQLDCGIAVVGCGAFNWYHWVTEVLPKALFARRLPTQFGDWPLIVPPEAASIPQFAEFLAIVSGGRQVHVANGGPVHVKDLIWIDSPSISPFNMTMGWPSPSHAYHHPDALGEVARILTQGGAADDGGSPRRVLLVRPQVRRTYNQQEVLDLATSLGFEPVAPESLPLREQVRLFQSAEVIVGPSGAAWTNLLFAGPTTRGLIWVGEQYRGFNVFANLAAVPGALVRYLLHPLDAKTTSQAYRAGYTLNIGALRYALRAVLSE